MSFIIFYVISKMLEPEAAKFEKLNEIKMLEHKAQLDVLEYLAITIDNLRESLTRELVVNDVKSEEELEKKIKKVVIEEEMVEI